MMNNKDLATNCYLNVYSKICEYSELMQPDEDERWSLPEIVITAFTTTVLVAFLNGLFGEIGKDLYSKIKEYTFGKRKLKYAEPEDLINELAGKVTIIEFTKEQIVVIQDEIKKSLIEIKISEKSSQKISSEIIKIILETYGDRKE